MSSALPPTEPYGSARDLPSVRELEQQVTAFKRLKFLLRKGHRQELERLEQEHLRITGVVDTFYALLGPRNWVYHGDLHLAEIEAAVDTDDPEKAEQRLIAYYKNDERLMFSMRRLHRHEALRPRRQLLDNALRDYQAGRYYSTVLVLIAVMDGFVNDFEKESRKGLHARPVEEMVAWDSVVGHHLGLSHAHKSFLKSFFKTSAEEVTQLYRNGIMHGVLVNFDNDVVATKAWNRLFAIADWADARIAQRAPVEPEPTFGAVLQQLREVQAQKKQLDRWQPHEHAIDVSVDEQSDVVRTCMDFLERWEKKQYGLVAEHFLVLGSQRATKGEQARLAKDLYSGYRLTEWSVRAARHEAAATSLIDAALVVNGEIHETILRWVRSRDGDTVAEWEDGEWSLAPYGPTTFLK